MNVLEATPSIGFPFYGECQALRHHSTVTLKEAFSGDYEVDVVIEDQDGQVVDIEVKSSATVTSGDFSDLRKLADACGKRFTLGLVLYDHDTVVPFDERVG